MGGYLHHERVVPSPDVVPGRLLQVAPAYYRLVPMNYRTPLAIQSGATQIVSPVFHRAFIAVVVEVGRHEVPRHQQVAG